jgi:hypothetical protein
VSVTRLAAVVLVTLALAGCGGMSDDESASTTPATTEVTQTMSDCQPLAEAALTARMSPAAENRETMYLTDVSHDAGNCSDMVTFEFEKQSPGPGFDVSYQPANVAKFEDASGNPIAVAGAAFLVVKLMPAMTAKIEGDHVTKTYTGPRRLTVGDDSIVRDVVKTGDFESVVTWVIGLDKQRRFTTDASDSQLVVEIDRS